MIGVNKYSRRNFDIFSVGLLATIFMAFQFFSVPAAQAVRGEWRFLDYPFLLSIAGIAAFLAGFKLIGLAESFLLRRDLSMHGSRAPWDAKRVVVAVTGLAAAGFAIKARHCIGLGWECGEVLESAAFAPNLLHQLALIVLLCHLATARQEKGDQSFIGLWPGLAAVLIVATWHLYSGAGRYFLVSILVSLMAIEWYFGHRRTIIWLMAAGSITVGVYLGATWLKFKAGGLSVVDMARMEFGDFLYEAVIGRLQQHDVLNAIVMYWQGPWLYFESWPDFFNQLLRRPLHFLDGNDFGKAFGVLHDSDMVTGIGPTFIGDFYLNGGTIGVLGGMLLVGSIYRLSYMTVTSYGGQCGVFIYVSMLPALIHGTEDWFFLSLGRIVSIAVICSLVCVFLRARRVTLFEPYRVRRRIGIVE